MSVRPFPSRDAFSLVEVAVSVAITGLLLASALQTVANSVAAQSQAATRSVAEFLAEDLMAEVLQKDYQDTAASAGLGVEAGESPSAKTTFDDVDDYAGWKEAPPQHRDGSTMTGLEGWERQVVVEWVTRAEANLTSLAESGVKRVSVVVRQRGTIYASRTALRSAAP